METYCGRIWWSINGYQWDGASWVGNSSIVSGLSDHGLSSSIVIFNNSGTWNGITTFYNHGITFYGYRWNGTSWVENSSIVSGLYIERTLLGGEYPGPTSM